MHSSLFSQSGSTCSWTRWSLDLPLPLAELFHLAAVGGLCIYKVELLIVLIFLVMLNVMFEKAEEFELFFHILIEVYHASQTKTIYNI